MDSLSSYSSTERYSQIDDDQDINKAALFLEIKGESIVNIICFKVKYI